MARRMACNPNQKIAGRFSQLLDKHGRWNGATCFDEAKLTEPGKWRKPQIVAVCWMGDLFINGDEADFERITMVFNAMEKHNAHTYLLLTKRPENLWEFIDWKQAQLSGWEPAPNIWLGTSVEDQRTADVRLPELLTCPGNLWVSAEPLIEQVTLRYIHHEGLIEIDALAGKCGVYRPLERPVPNRIRWVVCGGESGSGARALSTEWVRQLRDECAATDTPFLFKAWGGRQKGHDIDNREHAQVPWEVDIV